jgi:hypothetical protein
LRRARHGSVLGVGVAATIPLAIPDAAEVGLHARIAAQPLLQAGFTGHLGRDGGGNAAGTSLFVPRQSSAIAALRVDAGLGDRF